MFGRNGESPVAIIAPQSPSDCFFAGIEAAAIAVRHRIPVVLLSDGYLANSSEPWLLPHADQLPTIDPNFAVEPNHPDGFIPFLRDPETMARPWAPPGTPGLEHRIGGLEKHEVTGNISYDAANHQRMTEIRAQRIEAIAGWIPPIEVDDPTGDAELLVIGWGSTYGPIRGAVRQARDQGAKVARAHIRHLAPLPPGIDDLLLRYPKVLLPENNSGQLRMLLRARTLVDIVGHNVVSGQPFTATELSERILSELSTTVSA
jgi:2-oxoglutarate ferredoxin oxidoreductase subunit alpha